jgi:V-type H+-transporting ATPase subunit D
MAGQGQQRLNVVPTVTTLGMVKARLAGATRGHALLKKKSDALTAQFRAILKRIVSAKDAMGDAMRAASLSLAEALYVAGAPLRHVVQQSVSGPSRLRVRVHQDNIAGVRLPRFQSYLADDGAGGSSSLAGLAGGGQQVAACRAAHARALEVLVELASLQTSFLTLDAAIRTTNRRVNALENVVKPPPGEHHRLHLGRAGRARAGGVLPPQEDPGVQAAGARAPEGGRHPLRPGEGRRRGRAQARRFRRHCGEHAGERRQGRGYHLLILVPSCPLLEPVRVL